MVDPSSYFSFQPVLHDWCNKGRGMCYPVCGMVHIKEPLLLIGKSSPCGGSRFPLSLFDWSFIINLKPYNHKYNVLSVSLNKHFLPSCSFSHYQNKSCDQINPCFHPNRFIVLFWPWTIATNITLTTAVVFFAGFLSCSLPYTGCYKIFPSFFSCLWGDTYNGTVLTWYSAG